MKYEWKQFPEDEEGEYWYTPSPVTNFSSCILVTVVMKNFPEDDYRLFYFIPWTEPKHEGDPVKPGMGWWKKIPKPKLPPIEEIRE